MREILFRAKRLDNGEWVEGYLASFDLICPYFPEETTNATGTYYGETPYVGFVEVDPKTVGQYTGLTDKNSKKIFEGDIVKYPDTNGYDDYDELYNIGTVDWSYESMCFYFTNRWVVDMGDFDVENLRMTDVEVIGNVFENPELL